MSEINVELLAPAGSMEAFMGAIHAGADAVYLAGSKYGARAYADNFSEEELLFCIRYAHIWGRKVYLTINTLFKEWELHDLFSYLCPLYEAGLDACIIQDIGAFQYVKQYFPMMELHVSTQMTITGAYGAGFLKESMPASIKSSKCSKVHISFKLKGKHSSFLLPSTFTPYGKRQGWAHLPRLPLLPPKILLNKHCPE